MLLLVPMELNAIMKQDNDPLLAFLLIGVIVATVFLVCGCLLDFVRYLIVRFAPSNGLFGKQVLVYIALPLTGFSYFIFLLALTLPSMQYSREAARCQCCRNNMEQIGIALQKYHDEHGTFPPAYTVDEEGNPLHSWRTLILPYFDPEVVGQKWKEQIELIRLDELWDSEHNMQISERLAHTAKEEEGERNPESPRRSSVYDCPGSGFTSLTDTVYKMVVGNNAVGNLQGTSKSQIKRPLDKTIVIIEAEPAVPWMSPSDFTVEDFKNALFANEARKIRRAELGNYKEEYCERCSGYHRCLSSESELDGRHIIGIHGIELNILFADGTVKKYMHWKLPMSEMEAMSRIRE